MPHNCTCVAACPERGGYMRADGTLCIVSSPHRVMGRLSMSGTETRDPQGDLLELGWT